MQRFRTNLFMRFATVLVAMMAWLALSNRCALAQVAAAFQTEVVAAHDCCAPQADLPCHPQENGNGGPVPANCCQRPALILPVDAKAPVAPVSLLPADGLGGWATWPVLLPSPAQLPCPPVSTAWTAGLPDEIPALVEIVLLRSVHAHAPPQAA